MTKDEIPVQLPTNYNVISKHNAKKLNETITDLQKQLDVSKNEHICKDSMIREKDLRIQSLVEEMDGIRNESQEKEKRIFNLDKDFTEFKEQNQVKIDIKNLPQEISPLKKMTVLRS